MYTLLIRNASLNTNCSKLSNCVIQRNPLYLSPGLLFQTSLAKQLSENEQLYNPVKDFTIPDHFTRSKTGNSKPRKLPENMQFSGVLNAGRNLFQSVKAKDQKKNRSTSEDPKLMV